MKYFSCCGLVVLIKKKKKDPSLSRDGIFEIERLSKYVIEKISNIKENIDIFFCPSRRSEMSAKILKLRLEKSGLIVRNFNSEILLFSNYEKDYNSYWLKSRISKSDASVLIIIGHIELVRWFPEDIGYSRNYAKTGEGIMIDDDGVTDIVFDDFEKNIDKEKHSN